MRHLYETRHFPEMEGEMKPFQTDMHSYRAKYQCQWLSVQVFMCERSVISEKMMMKPSQREQVCDDKELWCLHIDIQKRRVILRYACLKVKLGTRVKSGMPREETEIPNMIRGLVQHLMQ